MCTKFKDDLRQCGLPIPSKSFVFVYGIKDKLISLIAMELLKGYRATKCRGHVNYGVKFKEP